MPSWLQKILFTESPFPNLQAPKTIPKDAGHPIVAALTQVMSMNRLSLDSLLGRFFDKNLLSAYCTSRLGQSGRGNASVLASRIFRAWSKPKFKLKPRARSAPRCGKSLEAEHSPAAAKPKKRKRPTSRAPNKAATCGNSKRNYNSLLSFYFGCAWKKSYK